MSDILPLYTNQGADASLVSTKLLSVETEGALSPELRAIEDWINAGFPKKALALLGGYAGPESDAARVRLESKARFYLKEYATAQLGKDESTKQSPDVVVLSIGAQRLARHLSYR
ncbi:hypothetical protein M2650_01855 [Luteimonas sp. SX5]|uniref:Uncharacterized protein n=1 Tax=Luteimonas galliterrae TaxID=2940486 RepID=A0ABT0MEU2_9GAMM|nr:hypothetical protein [Luteimonas galliterrae]